MLTQIYEVRTTEEAQAISGIGVDHIGAKIGQGSRALSVDDAARIAWAIRPPSKFSALFLTADVSLIEEWARELRPAIVHLGAPADMLSPDDVRFLKKQLPRCVIMRSVPVTGEESVAVAQSYDRVADYLLLDSIRVGDQKLGALGVTHDWSISRRIVELVHIPVILAGGLGPANVAEAIRLVRPAGVDSKTKTDRDGCHGKDIDRVRRFHEEARATQAML